MNRDDLQRLSKDELIDLVLRLHRPDKTSRTSSKPPSTDRTERRERSKPGGAKPGREGHSRRLCDASDAIEDHAPTHCPDCHLPFSADDERELIGEYDEIEIPPVKPFVRRHRRFAIRCACCGAMHPVAQRLPVHAAGMCRQKPRMPVQHHCNRQNAPRLLGIRRACRLRPQLRNAPISARNLNRRVGALRESMTCGIDSRPGQFGNPQESGFWAVGMTNDVAQRSTKLVAVV
jgi:hypothetical protein